MIKITRDNLFKMYQLKTSSEVAKELKITQPTLRKILKKNKIILKGSGNYQHNYCKVKVV